MTPTPGKCSYWLHSWYGHPAPQAKQQQHQHRGPQPLAPPITLLGLVWWTEHNLQLKCRKLRQGRVRNSVCVDAHLIRYWGKEKHKQTPWLMTHLCLLLCWQSAPHKLRVTSHNLPRLPARQQQPPHPSITMQTIRLALKCLFTSKQHKSRFTTPLLQYLTSWETTHGCPCWVLLLVEGDTGHKQWCAEL